jgi:lysophospholipase L1-like esterase
MTPQKNAVLKTVLAVAAAVVVLAAYRKFVDPAKGIAPGIFDQAARVVLFRHPPAPPVVVVPVKPKPGARVAVSDYFVDDSGAMDSFFAALHTLELPPAPAAPQVVTVLHYGDSPTTADLITGDVRAMLQNKFGDGGHGFLLTAKPWAWYQHRGVDISDKGWTASTAVGKMRDDTYGVGGASFEGTTGASSHITLKDSDQRTIEIAYLGRPGGGTVSVAANGAEVGTFSTAADSVEPAWHTVTLPEGTKSVDLKPVSGAVRLFGETFRTSGRGVVYDSLGLNGASTTVLSNGFNAPAWAAELQHERPALVIINYGTNESGFGSYVDKYYEPSLRTAIKRIKAALPGTPILVMSPMDRGLRSGVDEIHTYDTIPRIVAIQRRVAAEQGCAFFDTFDAMGGDGTMARWYTGHPRLVSGDLIHPTPQGAAMVAQLLVKDVMTAYEQYLERQHLEHHHEVVPPAVQPVVPAPSPVVKPAPVAPSAKPKPSAMGEPLAPVTPPVAAPVTPDPPKQETPPQAAPVVPPKAPDPQPQLVAGSS